MPAIVDVAFEERYWYPEDGGQVCLPGYQLVEPASTKRVADTRLRSPMS